METGSVLDIARSERKRVTEDYRFEVPRATNGAHAININIINQ